MSGLDPHDTPKTSEDRLRDALSHAADAAEGTSLDLPAVLAASRSARRTRRSAIVGGTFAVAGVVVIGGLAFGMTRFGAASSGDSVADAPIGAPESFADSSGGGETSGEDAGVAPRDPVPAPDVGLDPLATIARCGERLAELPNSTVGPLRVTLAPIGAVAPGATTTIVVTVENASDAVVAGSLRVEPILALADDADVVVQHSPASDRRAYRDIRLAPGESTELSGALSATQCSATGDERIGPPLPAGDYDVRAAVVFVASADGAHVSAATGPLAVR